MNCSVRNEKLDPKYTRITNEDVGCECAIKPIVRTNYIVNNGSGIYQSEEFDTCLRLLISPEMVHKILLSEINY